MKINRKIIDIIYLGFFSIFLLLFVSGQFTSITGYSLVVIDNADPNSMFPTYFQGDLFIIHKDNPSDIVIGDVIVYLSNSNNRIIHRVIDIFIDSSQNYFFRVKGDNPITNYRPDNYDEGTFIPFDAVLGEILFRAPYLGHLSLTLQQNIFIQSLMFIISIIAILFLFLWDEKENAEDKQYYDLTKSNISSKLSMTNLQFSSFLKLIFNNKNRIYSLLIFFAITFILILSIYSPNLLLSTDDKIRGIQSITYDDEISLLENDGLPDSIFVNVFITVYDNGNMLNYIESINLEVYYNNTLLTETNWNTFRPIKGEFTYGGSIIIPSTHFELFGESNTIIVILTPYVNTLFGSELLDSYNSSTIIDI